MYFITIFKVSSKFYQRFYKFRFDWKKIAKEKIIPNLRI